MRSIIVPHVVPHVTVAADCVPHVTVAADCVLYGSSNGVYNTV